MSTTTDKSKSISFNAEMLRLTIDGNKTQTRRVIFSQPLIKVGDWRQINDTPNWIELTKASMRGVLQLEHKPISDFFDIAAAKSLDDLDSVYRKMRSQHHPDRGGDAATFNALVTEYEAAKAKLKNGGGR